MPAISFYKDKYQKHNMLSIKILETILLVSGYVLSNLDSSAGCICSETRIFHSKASFTIKKKCLKKGIFYIKMIF
jgi:hypothetical protein